MQLMLPTWTMKHLVVLLLLLAARQQVLITQRSCSWMLLLKLLLVLWLLPVGHTECTTTAVTVTHT
jgi:hypothetical protein